MLARSFASFALGSLALVLGLGSQVLAQEGANPVEAFFKQALATDGFKRIPKQSFYEGGAKGTAALVMVELRCGPDKVESEFVEVKRSGGWEGERATVGLNGVLESLENAKHVRMGEPPRENVVKGKLEGGKLILTKGTEKPLEREVPAGPVLPMPVVLFVVSAYPELLPEDGLAFGLLLGTRVVPGFKVQRGKLADGLQEVRCFLPDQFELSVYVSTAEATRGRVEKLSVDGEVKNRLEEKAAEKILKDMAKQQHAERARLASLGAETPEALIEALIEACKKKRLPGVAKLFSPKAPGEFQQLVKGTAKKEEFDAFCLAFSEAKILEIKTEGDTARAVLQLSKRKETLKLVKEAGRWTILDF